MSKEVKEKEEEKISKKQLKEEKKEAKKAKKEKPKKSIWKKIKITLIIIGIIVLLTAIFLAVVNIMMPVNQKESKIKFSQVYEQCDNLDKCNITDLLFDNVSYLKLLDLEIKDVDFDLEENKYELVIWAYGIFGNMKEYKFKFTIDDDMAPFVMKEKSCTYYIGDEFDINDCLDVYDYEDGSIKLSNKDVDFKSVNLEKVGKGNIEVTLEDSEGNKSVTSINLKVRNIPIDKFELKDGTSEVEENKTIKLDYVIKPDKIEDKTVTWSSKDENIAKVDSEGTVTGVKEGTTEICAVSNYDKDKKSCKEITVTMACKNTYTFNYDSNEKGKIVVGEDICPGSYKIYADKVKDSYDWYDVRVYESKSDSYADYYTIAKDSYDSNDEGSSVKLRDGGYIELDKGILSFRLVKVS